MADSHSSKLFLLGKRLLTIARKNPRRLRPVLGHAFVEAENHLEKSRDMSRLPVVPLPLLVDSNQEPLEIVTSLFPQVIHSIAFIEAVALGVLLQKARAWRVFEFGTNRGVSTTQLALNVTPDGCVFTLDLPRQPGAVPPPGQVRVKLISAA